MKPTLSLTTATVLFGLSVYTPSAFGEPVTLDAEPVRVSMFKNGLAMVTSRTQVPGPGTYQVPTPEARYGSLWLNWGNGLALDQIISTQSTRTEPINALTIKDVLEANVGKTFSIPIPGKTEWQTVTLLSMPAAEIVHEIGTVPYPDSRGYGGPVMAPPFESQLILLKTEQGVEARHANSISMVRFDDGQEMQTTFQRQVIEPVLRFDAAEADGEGDQLELNYLAQGIAWSPSYVVELLDDESVRVACKAVIVNDLMDLKSVDVELIAGYPNIQFASVPTAMGRTPLNQLLQLLMQSGRNQPQGVMANAMVMQQRVQYSSATSSMMPTMPTQPVSGEGAEDLYFYQLTGITLAKGERGYYPLLLADVPACPHVYTWEIVDYVDPQGRFRAQPEDFQQVVWHSLELTNTTEQPWTTAPAMTVKDGHVLGQDTLHFVPPGGSTLLRITKAISIDAQHNEFEIERERNVEKFHGSTYDKVTIEGTLKITNHKAESVTVRITKTVTGEVMSADGGPEVVKIASGLRGVNPRSKLTWEVEVTPGREQAEAIVYRYSFYTR